MATSFPTADTAARLERLANAPTSLEVYYGRAQRALDDLVGFDAACWLGADPTTLMITEQWSLEVPDRLADLARNEYQVEDVNKFADLASRRIPAATLDTATGGRPHRSSRYVSGLRPAGFGPELRVALVENGTCWGFLVLLREHGRADFDPGQVDAIGRLARLIARAIRIRVLNTSHFGIVSDASGVLLIDADGHHAATTPTAHRYLSELTGRAAASLTALAAAARARGSASVCVLGAGGTWLTLDAEVLIGGPARHVSIVVQPAAPASLAPRLLATYDLTPRERDVAGLVLAGYSTDRIARTLSISAYTVQDHLRAIFDKIAVRSRRDLVARFAALMGTPGTGRHDKSSGW